MNWIQFGLVSTGVDEGAIDGFRLAQNYPNPFNPETTISYELPEQAAVNLTIYDMKGETIITLINNSVSAGNHRIKWDGNDSSGQLVQAGVYFCRLTAGGTEETIKMVYLR